MWRIVIILVCFSIFKDKSFAQVIDYTSTFKSHENKLLRLHFDNDYFTQTDRYYSDGLTLEFLHPILKKSPLNHLLIKSKVSECRYGIAFSAFYYTPTDFLTQTILYGDRPFCGNITLSNFITSTDTIRKRMITSIITLGIIGQGAGGKETQTSVHRWLNNLLPEGWDNQIRNDIILNYQINYEKRIWANRNNFLLNACTEITAGTHTNKIKTGLNFMIGKFNNPYESISHVKKKFRWHLYGRCQPALVIYDATLQGGMFDTKSPYIISADQIKRFTAQGDYGIVMTIKKIYLEYCQSILTKEFNTGKYHRWGGIRIGMSW